MIDKRLISLIPESRTYTLKLLLLKIMTLLTNIGLIYFLIDYLWTQHHGYYILILLFVKVLLIYLSGLVSAKYSQYTKSKLRAMILQQLFTIESNYRDALETSELVQLSLDGVTQLDAYYNLYIPQFFYSLIAPMILFLVLSFFYFKTALILLIAVPLIPLSIIAVQKFAKKLLNKYWGNYTQLGNIFLDRLQGLLPLKIFQAENRTLNEIDQQAESFRLVTMRVLMMQLNSISMMDLVAYGGSAIAMIVALMGLQKGEIIIKELVFITLLSADYFIPMRQLGSYFHLSMNGVAASDKINRFLSLPDPMQGQFNMASVQQLKLEDVSIFYDQQNPTVSSFSMTVEKGSFHVIVGESGSGKSSIAKAILNQVPYQGKILLNGKSIKNKKVNHLILGQVGRVDLFNFSLYENMTLGYEHSRQACRNVLDRLDLAYLNLSEDVQELGSNFSGGEKQRIVLSRLILNPRDFYIFDEVTSNVDVESEAIIMNEIDELRRQGCGIILITHRLKNAEKADMIHVLDQGKISERGTHQFLLGQNGNYAKRYYEQSEVESIGN